MTSLAWFLAAAFLEIFGCFAFWRWLRLDGSVWWVVPGVAALVLFGLALTQAEPVHAGRTFAAYGGIYVASSLAWLVLVEGERPLWTDMAGVGLCIAGTVVILLGSRAATG